MKNSVLFWIHRFGAVLGFMTLALFSPAVADAQITGSKSGTVVSPTPEAKQGERTDLSVFDFRNFSFPDPLGTAPDSLLKMTNGAALKGRIVLAKTYFFQLTQDEYDEAISMILDSGCESGCSDATRFYVHSPGPKLPELIFRFASGSGQACGLRSADFSINRFTIEVFGDCELKNEWIAVSRQKSSGKATRFVFESSANGFRAVTRETIIAPPFDPVDFRPRISFGGPQ